MTSEVQAKVRFHCGGCQGDFDLKVNEHVPVKCPGCGEAGTLWVDAVNFWGVARS